MSGTLDQFMPPTIVKSKPDSGIFVEERCSNPKCGKILGLKEPKYTIRSKGKEAVYCRDCAKAILPKPPKPETEEVNKEEGCINSHTVFRKEQKW